MEKKEPHQTERGGGSEANCRTSGGPVDGKEMSEEIKKRTKKEKTWTTK